MYGQIDESTTQRKKLIIVSAVMGIIILILAGVLVNAIINKNKKPASEIASEGVIANDEEPGENSEVSRAESAGNSSENSESNSAESENLNPVSNENDGNRSAGSSSESSSASEAKKLPQTGPREALSLALLLGSCVMFVSSKLYLKELA